MQARKHFLGQDGTDQIADLGKFELVQGNTFNRY